MTAAACLGGCAVGPDFVSPSAPEVGGFTPDKVTSIASSGPGKAAGQTLEFGGTIPQRWWALFHDKALNRLVESAIEHNPSVAAAEASIRVAYYTAEAQKGAFLPSIGYNSATSFALASNNQSNAAIALAQAQTNLQSAQGLPATQVNTPGYNTAQGLFLKQLSVSYTPDIWGLNRRTVESLEAQTDQQRYQLEAAYLTLTSNVVTAAIQEASLRGQIAAVQKVTGIERDLLGLLKSQKTNGYVAESDVLTQEAALAQALELLPPLEKQLAQQRDLLTALAGRYSTAEVGERFNLSSLHLPRKLPVTLPSRFVRQRPDVRAAEANMHSASALIGVAIATRLPNITLSANGGFSAYELAQLFSPGTALYTLAASTTAPLFQGFTLLNKQKAAEAGFDVAEAQYRQSVITAFQNVADALRALQADTRAVAAANYAEEISRKNLDIVRAQLKLGSVNVLSVLNAQQTYLLAIVNRVQAEGNRLSDVAALFMALGGGWFDENLKNLPPNEPATPATPETPTAEQVEKIDAPVNTSLLPSIP